MFKCGICGEITKAGEKQNKKIVETREKEYVYVNKHGKEVTSKGSEIVKEINVCEKCSTLVEEVGE